AVGPKTVPKKILHCIQLHVPARRCLFRSTSSKLSSQTSEGSSMEGAPFRADHLISRGLKGASPGKIDGSCKSSEQCGQPGGGVTQLLVSKRVMAQIQDLMIIEVLLIMV